MELDKNKTALLVMDFQNDIVHEKGAFAAMGIPAHVKQQNAIENTKKILEKARSSGMKVVFVTVSYEKGYPELQNNKIPMLAGLQGSVLVKGEWGAEIVDELKPKEGEAIVNKSRINPFTSPQLTKELEGKDTLLLAGVATNYVVEATARHAADADYKVIIMEDCCASMAQAPHDFTLKNILSGLATISNSTDILKSL